MTIYLLESFLILLAVSAVFFLLGTSLGWVLWGRFKKMLGEWRCNSERLNKRISNLEEEADRSHLSRHELETEKAEILEVFARRNRESHDVAVRLEVALAALAERERSLTAHRDEIEALEEEIRLLKTDVKGLMEALAKRDALVEALNDRIESIQRDRDDRTGILKAKILAAEQERDERKNEAVALAKQLAAREKPGAGQSPPNGAKRRGTASRATAKAGAGVSRKAGPPQPPANGDEVGPLTARNVRSRRAAKREAVEPVARGGSQLDLGLNS